MDNFKCHIGNCPTPASEFCQTCNLIFCKPHSHTSIANHKSSEIVKSLSDSDKLACKQLTSWAISKCSQTRKDILASSKALIDLINTESTQLISKLDSILSQAYSLHSTISYLDSILLYKNPNKDQETAVEYFQNSQTLQSFKDLEKFRPSLIENIIKQADDFLIYSTPMQHPVTSMSFFTQKSKILQVYNLNDNTFQSKDIKIFMGDRAGWCYLPDGKVFHYGGRDGSGNSDSAYIINPSKMSIEAVKKNKEMRNIGELAYFEGNVYVFGGFNKGNNSNSAFRYSLVKDSWKEIAKMPLASEDCSACGFGNTVIVTGFNLNGIFEYNPRNDCYLLLVQMPEQYKILWSADGRCFGLANNSVFETEFLNKTSWSSYVEETTRIEHKRLLAPIARKGKEMFMLFENRHLYKFHLETKRISLVTIIPNFD